jgi:hypothetical protein
MKSHCLAVVIAGLLAWTAPVYARDDGGQKYSAPPDIVAGLPRICWYLYMDNVPNTPEFSILDCGAFSNHYCPGLVAMAQADRARDNNKRLELLRLAKSEMEYTLHWTENIPECSVRLRAQMNLKRIEFQIDMLKFKVQKR